MKKLTSFILSALVVFSFVACDDTLNNELTELNKEDVKVWTTQGTEKILQDVTYLNRTDNVVEVDAFKNEYESGQIIISAKKDVKSYSLQVSDLTCGEATFSKENITLYAEKYIDVIYVKETAIGAQPGSYPDALLPMETCIKHGENKVAAGENQGVWLEFFIPENQTAGTYTGNVTVTCDNLTYTVPVSLTVYDLAITTESHSKSSYAVYLHELANGELDNTVAMEKKYVDYLLNYRMSPQMIPTGEGIAYYELEDTELFLDAVIEYAKNPKCSYYNLPYASKSVLGLHPSNGVWTTVLDVELQKEFYKKTILRSLEEKVNIFEKAGTYFIFMDEAQNNVGDRCEEQALYTTRVAKEMQEALYAEYDASTRSALQSEYGVTAEFLEEVLRDMRELKNLFTGHYDEQFDGLGTTYVPTIDRYHEAEERDFYEHNKANYYQTGEKGELWCYTAMNPYSPYPTFHTEDYLLTSRLLGWMMYDYNITGSLYWDTTLYAWRKDNFNNLPLLDYYDTALRFPFANGDGYLVYPGKPYGIDGPVGTVRLQSFRDGMEDYEILYQIETCYQEILGAGYTGSEFELGMRAVFNSLYSGVKANVGEKLVEKFRVARENLATIWSLAKEENTILTDYQIAGNFATITLQTPENNAVKADDTALTPISTANGVSVYQIEKNLNSAVNSVNVQVTCGNETYTVAFDLGEKINMIEASALLGNVTTVLTGDSVSETVDTVLVDGVATEFVKANFAQAGKLHTVNINPSAIGYTMNSKELKIELYNYNDYEIELRVDFKLNGEITTMSTIKLAPGRNVLKLSENSAADLTKTLESISLRVRTTNDNESLGVGKMEIKG